MAQTDMKKVFLIGRMKTGTRSIDKALKIIGYKTYSKHEDLDSDNLAKDVIKKTKKIAAFTANANFTIGDIKALEEAYPDAVFILTEREPDKWYVSWVRHHMKAATKDDPREVEIDYQKKPQWVNFYYNEFNHKVLTHFKGREWKLLHVFYGKGKDSWGSLCSFLNRPVPKGGFPHENISR